MSQTSRHALQSELSLLRNRHGQYRGTLSFVCDNLACPVQTIVVVVEEADGVKRIQNPVKCPRCTAELSYRGAEVGRTRNHPLINRDPLMYKER